MEKLVCFALNEGMLAHIPLDQFLKIAVNSGYSGVTLWMDCLDEYIKAGHSAEETCNLIQSSKLKIVELTFRHPWLFVQGQVRKQMLIDFEQTCFFAKNIQANFISLPAYGNKGDDLEFGRKSFIELCNIAEKHKLKLGIENLLWSPIDTVLSAWEFVQSTEKQNAGILVDAFQFFKSNSTLKDLEKIPVDKIFVVHMRDHLNSNNHYDPLTQAREYSVFPGEGDFDLKSLIKELKDIGYQGYYSLETQNKNFLTADPAKLALQGIASLEKLFLSLI